MTIRSSHATTEVKKLAVSVVVPVKNEEANLSRCLDQLNEFSEVIVVDSSSTDNTPLIAKQKGATYINFQWNGRYPKKRNWVLINHPLKNDWVLFLDADEFVDIEFCRALGDAVRSEYYNAYWINYTNYFLGKRLQYGVKQRKLALLKVGCGLYERIEEDDWSSLDMEIHEHPVIEGEVGEISALVEHNDDRGVPKFIARHLEYARWEARRFALLHENRAVESEKLTKRQKFKYRNLDRWWYPWLYFVHTYFVKLGFLDGRPGFAYAFYKAWYFLSIRLIIQSEQNE